MRFRTIGIGLFIAFIGLVNSRIVIHPERPIVTLNPDLTTLRILTFAIGLAVTAGLVERKTREALLIGILFTTVVATFINEIWGPDIWTNGVAQIPSKIVSTPDFVGNFSITGVFDAVPFLTAIVVSVLARCRSSCRHLPA